MIRIIFTADNHLGRFYAKMSPEQLLRRRRRLREAWAETVDFAVREGAHFYLHGGDLFDSPNPRTAELAWVARQFRRLADAGIPTYAIGGNHDVPKIRGDGVTPQRIYDEVRFARVFGKTTEVEWVTHTVESTTIAIGGLSSDPRLRRDDDPLEGVAIEPPEADVVLLMLHYGVEGTLRTDANEPLIPKARLNALDGIVDYLLLGHVHHRRKLEIGRVQVAFSGPTERLSFGESGVETGFLDLKFEGRRPNVRVSLRYRPVRAQPMRREEIRTTDLPASDPNGAIFEKLRAVSHADQLLQFKLVGPLPRTIYHQVRFFDIWRLGNELNFFFDLDRRGVYLQTEIERDGDPAGERVSPRQEMERVAAELVAGADEEERALIDEAKALVLGRWLES